MQACINYKFYMHCVEVLHVLRMAETIYSRIFTVAQQNEMQLSIANIGENSRLCLCKVLQDPCGLCFVCWVLI